MEQDTDSLRLNAVDLRDARSNVSLVDSLFAMPERIGAKRASQQQEADTARLEARLAAEMRKLIAARLRAEKAG